MSVRGPARPVTPRPREDALKSVGSTLDVLESATLIGMLKGTSYYNPVQNPERARQRRNLVLAQMARHGDLDATRLEALSRRPLKIDFERQKEGRPA